MTPMILQTTGKYVVDRFLGRGGMAEVFVGRKIGAEGVTVQVAVKRIRPDYCKDNQFRGEFRQMFVTEARLNARLEHDNIVSILDFGEDEAGELFLVMELVDGLDLNALLRTGRLPLPVALFVANEILQGLAHAHDLPAGDDGVRGLVHRDVSPQNILLSWDGAVKVSDFGIAKARAGTHASESLRSKGKFAYLSPEYARGRALDGRSDLFAVGVVLWEMLVGEPLFNRDTDAATISSVLFEPAPSPRLNWPEIPADIERVTMCLLEKDRDDRYSNSKAAITAIKDCAAFSKHACELLSSLLLERFPDHVPHRHGGQAPPKAPAPTEHVADADPSLTRAAPPAMKPAEPQVSSYRAVEKRFTGLLARQSARPAMRLAMFGAVVMVAAIVAIIATSIILHDSGSGIAVGPPPSVAPPSVASPSVAPPNAAPPSAGSPPPQTASPAVRASDEPSLPPVHEHPKITAGEHSEDPASIRQVNRRLRSAPAPVPPNRARIIKIDLDRLQNQ